ncbi:hypothetical protein BASA81_003611 [Batrachochytrium salamandrivorans]|nr:hypothetical protein BASA81_003611 [Batrachochytrium salamandrivorans]
MLWKILLLLAVVLGAWWRWSLPVAREEISMPFFKTKSPTPSRNLPIPGTPEQVPHEDDCMVRNLAFEFAKRIVAERRFFKIVYEALALDSCAPYAHPHVEEVVTSARNLEEPELEASVLILYCDPIKGKDGHSGSKDKPLLTIQEALKRVETYKASRSQIILREGVFFLEKALLLTPAHSELIVRNFASERVVLSGARRIKIPKSAWKRVGEQLSGSKPGVIWKTTLSSNLLMQGSLHGLRLGNNRMVRAKSPNGHPEQSQHNGAGWYSREQAEWIKPSPPKEKSSVLVESTPSNWPLVEWPDTPKSNGDGFDSKPGMAGRGEFQLGNNGGECGNKLHPGLGYFCTTHNALGGEAMVFRSPSAVTKLPLAAGHTMDKGSLVVAWTPSQSHTWTFEVDKMVGRAQAKFKTSTAGIQGAMGADVGGDFYLENFSAALDDPGEFYFNSATRELFVCLNATQKLSGLEDWGLVLSKELIHLQSQGNKRLVKNVQLLGLEFRDTAASWLEPHSAVSGGDWTLPKSAAVMAFGVDNLHIKGCTFERLDGSAVLLFGLARGVLIESNEFAFLGASGVVSWGTTSACLNYLCTHKLPVTGGNGPDGRAGFQPRGTKVIGNVFRELGVFVKQSAGYFTALSGQSTVSDNIMFNLPKSAITFHDGFLGGDVVERNLIFNTAKEASAGPIDLVDRLPFIWEGAAGESTTLALQRVVRGNFVLANYKATAAVAATRDGASQLTLLGNVLVYGQVGLESQLGGRGLEATGNLFLHLQSRCFLPTNSSSSKDDDNDNGIKMRFANNTCLLTNANYGYASACSAACLVGNNTVSSLLHGPLRVQCQKRDETLQEYLDKHPVVDKHTVELSSFPSPEQITLLIRQLLAF